MEITVYTFEGGDSPLDFMTYYAGEAQQLGQEWGCRVLANEFEFADSELVWDFTKQNEDPPLNDSKAQDPSRIATDGICIRCGVYVTYDEQTGEYLDQFGHNGTGSRVHRGQKHMIPPRPRWEAASEAPLKHGWCRACGDEWLEEGDIVICPECHSTDVKEVN